MLLDLYMEDKNEYKFNGYLDEDLIGLDVYDNDTFKGKIIDIYKRSFTSNDYVFVVGFNQDILPKTHQDIDYISDNIKYEVDMYTTDILNEREKLSTIYLLSKIKNLVLSYKEKTPFESFYPSSLISEYNYKVIKPEINYSKYSNIYNTIKLTEMLDQYYLYGEKANLLESFYHHYKIDYRTYSNQFTGISSDTYLKNLDYPLKISYTGCRIPMNSGVFFCLKKEKR